MNDDTTPAIFDTEEYRRALDYRYVSLQVAASEFGGAGDDPSDFFHESSGTVELRCLETDIHFTIGEFSVIQVDLEGAWRSGMTVYEVMDITAPSFDLFQTLYKKSDYSRAAVKALGGYPTGSENILILDRLLVLPSFRGRGLGLDALRLMMRRFGLGAGIIALKAFPLQFEPDTAEDLRLGLTGFKCSYAAAQRKLISLYQQAGFASIGRTPYMLHSGETALQMPMRGRLSAQ
mgnify:CR=1 FL=1